MLQIPCAPGRQQALGILREHGRALTAPSQLPQRAGSRDEAETLRAIPPGSLRASAPTARPCPGRPHPLSASAAPQRRLNSAGPNRAPASQPRTLPPGPAPTPSGASRSLPSQPPGPHLGAACGRSGARGRGLCALGSAAPRQNGGRGRALTSRPFPSPVPSRHARGREGGWGGSEGRGEKGCPRPPGRGWSNRSAARRAARPIGAARPQGGTRARPRWPRGEGVEL